MCRYELCRRLGNETLGKGCNYDALLLTYSCPPLPVSVLTSMLSGPDVAHECSIPGGVKLLLMHPTSAHASLCCLYRRVADSVRSCCRRRIGGRKLSCLTAQAGCCTYEYNWMLVLSYPKSENVRTDFVSILIMKVSLHFRTLWCICIFEYVTVCQDKHTPRGGVPYRCSP